MFEPAVSDLWDHQKVIFPDQEDSNWAYDELAEQYYLHRFYSSEPDLNVAHPDVRDEVNRIMGFWLELGVSGFMRGFLTRRRGDAVLFGEVNLDLGERETYFGDAGDEMTGLFDFIMCGTVFTAMAKEKARGVQGDRHGGVPPEESMRIYGRGIRRRLPPMVAGDRRRIELAFSLLLTLPGTALIGTVATVPATAPAATSPIRRCIAISPSS